MHKRTKENIHCWICGEEADSREHRIKRSDIKQILGEASQSKPIYVHDDKQRNKKIQSTNAKIFKGEKDLCAKCNNELTQPYDKAWERLSSYLNSNWSTILDNGGFRMSKAFPYKSRIGMLGVHLYFAKLFGCAIKEGIASMDIKQLADGIKSFETVPNFWLAIGPTPGAKYMNTVGRTNLVIASDKKDNKEVAATQLYTYGDFSILIEFSTTTDIVYDSPNNWHPTRGTKIFGLSKLEVDKC